MDLPIGLIPLLRALPHWRLPDWAGVDRGLAHLADAVRDEDRGAAEAALRFLTGFDPTRRDGSVPGAPLYPQMEEDGLHPLPDSTREVLNRVLHGIGVCSKTPGVADAPSP